MSRTAECRFPCSDCARHDEHTIETSLETLSQCMNAKLLQSALNGSECDVNPAGNAIGFPGGRLGRVGSDWHAPRGAASHRDDQHGPCASGHAAHRGGLGRRRSVPGAHNQQPFSDFSMVHRSLLAYAEPFIIDASTMQTLLVKCICVQHLQIIRLFHTIDHALGLGPPIIKTVCKITRINETRVPSPKLFAHFVTGLQPPEAAEFSVVVDTPRMVQVGTFPHYGRWAEWNGKFRDTVKNFIKGTDGFVGEFAECLCGSPNLYNEGGRKPYHSINFVTAHDGFTMYDLVSYNEKHNEANGENNNDGEKLQSAFAEPQVPDVQTTKAAFLSDFASKNTVVLFINFPLKSPDDLISKCWRMLGVLAQGSSNVQ